MVIMGKPVVKNTQITVEPMLMRLSAGDSIDQILEANPRLTKETTNAALEFATYALKDETT